MPETENKKANVEFAILLSVRFPAAFAAYQLICACASGIHVAKNIAGNR